MRYAPLYYHRTRHSAILSVTDQDARFSPAPTTYCPPVVLYRHVTHTQYDGAYTKNGIALFYAVHWPRCVCLARAHGDREQRPLHAVKRRASGMEWGEPKPPKVHERITRKLRESQMNCSRRTSGRAD